MGIWHGTTESAAEQIPDRGFERRSIASIVGAVATEHGLAEGDLFAMLKTAGRFAVIQHRSDDSVWFARSNVRAVDWAQRAPERRYEALWAVWWLTHGGTRGLRTVARGAIVA